MIYALHNFTVLRYNMVTGEDSLNHCAKNVALAGIYTQRPPLCATCTMMNKNFESSSRALQDDSCPIFAIICRLPWQHMHFFKTTVMNNYSLHIGHPSPNICYPISWNWSKNWGSTATELPPTTIYCHNHLTMVSTLSTT